MSAKLRIGVLHDFPAADGGVAFERNARRGMQPLFDTERLPDDIEFVHATGLGTPLPGGSAANVVNAFDELVANNVIGIIGPAISDNAITIRELADHACVPCINYTGSEETRSEYNFQFQIGSLEEEPSFLAEHLARRSLTKVAVLHDDSYVGLRMATFFNAAREVANLKVVRRGEADAIVSLGMWGTARALADEQPEIPVVANSALIYGYHDRSGALAWEGWSFPDTISETNTIYQTLGDPGPGVAGQFDLGRLIGEGIARATSATGQGLMDGLERVKCIPAATGEDGTTMGFGRCDRGALKGKYLVIRKWQAGVSRSWQ